MKCPRCGNLVLRSYSKCPKCGMILNTVSSDPKQFKFDDASAAPDGRDLDESQAQGQPSSAQDKGFWGNLRNAGRALIGKDPIQEAGSASDDALSGQSRVSNDSPRAGNSPNSDTETPRKPSAPIEGVDVVKHKAVWSIAPGQIARRITEREIADCSEVEGIIVQDGVTAVVYADGAEACTLSGGVYNFATKQIIEKVKDSIIEESVKKKENRGLGSRIWHGFLNIIGAEKNGERKDAEKKRKQIIKEKVKNIVADKVVVSAYLVSNRVFQEVFGSEMHSDGSYEFKPYALRAGFFNLEVGVSMLLHVEDFVKFSTNYLADKTSVGIIDIQRMMDPWVKQILQHALEKIDYQGNEFSALQESQLKVILQNLLTTRLFGIGIVQILDVTTHNDDFERFRRFDHDLWVANKEADYYVRSNQFRNRLTGYEYQQELEEAQMGHHHTWEMSNEDLDFKYEMNQLNEDKILKEDEFQRFLELHDIEVRIRRAQNIADEQTKMIEVEKALQDLKAQRLVNQNEYEAIVDEVKNKKYEREQLNDVIQHTALVKATQERLQMDTDLTISQMDAQNHIDIHQNDQQAQLDIHKIQNESGLEAARFEALRQQMGNEADRVDLEAVIYGRKYVLDKQKAIDQLGLEETLLDGNIVLQRKKDDYLEEQYQLSKKHERDEWEEDFAREGKLLDRNFNQFKEERNFSFEQRKREQELQVEHARKIQEIEQGNLDHANKRQMDLMQQKIEARNQGMAWIDKMRNAKLAHEENMAQIHSQADLEKTKLYSGMTVEQIEATNLKDLSPEAQEAYMDAKKEGLSSAKALEAAQEMMRKQEESQQQLLDGINRANEAANARVDAATKEAMALYKGAMDTLKEISTHAMDATANIAAGKSARDDEEREHRHQEELNKVRSEAELNAARQNADWNKARADEYKDEYHRQQSRTDETQSQSLRYTTLVSGAQLLSGAGNAHPQQTADEGIVLSCKDLKDAGFQGSFNDLGKAFQQAGGTVNGDQSESGPVLKVTGLGDEDVASILQKFGVKI